MRKSLLFVALLTFSSMILAAKSYSVTIPRPAEVGGVQLGKGEYSLQVTGDKVVFTDAKYKTTSVPVKVDSGAGKKFEFTSVESSSKDGKDVIKVIHLGGSTTSVEFAN